MGLDLFEEKLNNETKTVLLEDSRTQLLNKSKRVPKGNQRYKRRIKSKVASNVRQFNSVDMNKLFKENILTVNIAVRGETDNYIVKIKFGGFLDLLHKELKKNNDELNLRCIIRALVNGFNQEDVYIHCSCPDFHYRFGFWTTKNGTNSGEPENRPSIITNPTDNLGSGCKHILLVLSNTSWIVKLASVIKNYISYAEKHMQRAYEKIIFPAIYEKEYEEPVELSLFDDDELETDEETIDYANKDAVERTRFKQGNEQGIRFAKEDDKDAEQLSLLDDEEE